MHPFKVGDKVLIDPKMKNRNFAYGWNSEMRSLYTKPGIITRTIGQDVRVCDAQEISWSFISEELISAIVLNKNKLGNFPRKKV